MIDAKNHTPVAPPHIAIIMDGNGRWAQARGLSRLQGHAQGVVALREILTAVGEWGSRYLTVYAFSTENWQRPAAEISGLMDLLVLFLQNEIANLQKNQVRLRVLGDWRRLPEAPRQALENAITQLNNNTGCSLVLALSYGGRDEITRAVKKIGGRLLTGALNAEQITPELFGEYLDLPELPPVDLLIRTGGEKRLSNFLLWQASYAELYFTDTAWPDFSRAHLTEAIAEFHLRQRRFGKV